MLGFYPLDSTEAEREFIRSERQCVPSFFTTPRHLHLLPRFCFLPRTEYEAVKKQWTSISPLQEQYFSKFRERKHRIEKDVVRTDRQHPYYEHENGHHLVMLNDILVTYTFFNFDLGYVQGMNDLLSPILCVMDNESEAFWCFVGYMETMASFLLIFSFFMLTMIIQTSPPPSQRHNFDKDQHGMHNLLLNLKKILQVLDPQLYQYFGGVSPSPPFPRRSI